MATSILGLPHVKIRTGLSRSSIYNYMAMGAFPRPISLGPRRVGWLESEIEEWIAIRVAWREEGRRPERTLRS